MPAATPLFGVSLSAVSGFTQLFRTVQRPELNDLARRRRFRTVPGSIEGKLFWTGHEDAERFARLLARTGIGPSWVVEASVEGAALNRLPQLMTDARPARFVAEDDLDWFNGVVMGLTLPAPRHFVGSDG